MIFRKALFVLCSSAAFVAGQNRDVQMGMQGLMEAGQNPELLAQLFQDMQVRTTLLYVRTGFVSYGPL